MLSTIWNLCGKMWEEMVAQDDKGLSKEGCMRMWEDMRAQEDTEEDMRAQEDTEPLRKEGMGGQDDVESLWEGMGGQDDMEPLWEDVGR